MKKIQFLTILLAALFYYSVPAFATLTGAGTAADPYLIGSAADLNEFATGVNDGSITNHNVKLTADIDFSATNQIMIGTNTNKYVGVFDGDGHKITVKLVAKAHYCALFQYTNATTIKNLHVSGTVSMGAYKYGAGVVAHAYGTLDLSHVTCDVTIDGSESSAYHGGLVSNFRGNSTATDCAFYGKFTGTSTMSKGMFAFRPNPDNGHKVTFVNCFVDVLESSHGNTKAFTNNDDVIINSNSKNNFVSERSAIDSKTTTNYVVVEAGHNFENDSVAFKLNHYLCNGIWKQDTHHPALYSGKGLTISGCLAGDGTEESPLEISSKADLLKFADLIAKGLELTSYVKVTNDITSVDFMIGNKDNYFAGVFDGGDHTITLNLEAGAQYCALFQYTGAATIKNLHISGTIAMGTYANGASVVAYSKGALTLSRVSSDVTITSSVTTAATKNLGGLLSYITANCSIINCAFYGQFTGKSTYSYGMVAQRSGSQTVTFQNCYVDASVETTTNSFAFSCNIASDSRNMYISERSNFANKQVDNKIVFQESNANFDNGTVAAFLNGFVTNGTWKQGLKHPLLFSGTPAPTLNGDGTEAKPYKISSKTDLTIFATITNRGVGVNSYATLTENIDNVDFMVGNSNYPFIGTFDGGDHTITLNLEAGAQYCALFQYTGAATIKNLHISGTIAMGTCANGASVVAYSKDALTLSRVSSDVTIASNVTTATDKRLGGLLSYITANCSIINCAFYGQFTGKSTYSSGMIAQRSGSQIVTFQNCFVDASVETTTNSFAFCPNDAFFSSTCGNNYLSECSNFVNKHTNKVSEKKKSEFTDGTVATLLNNERCNGIWKQGTLRPSLFSGDTIMIEGCLIGAGTEEDPILITCKADFDKFKNLIERGSELTSYFKLTADIDTIKYTIGNSKYYFMGTFDGNYHKITIDITASANNTGLFMHVGNSTFKNLHIAGKVNGGSYAPVAGLVGMAKGDITMYGVTSNATISSTSNASPACVGLVANCSNCKMDLYHCCFTGIFDNPNGTCAGLLGAGAGSQHITDCYTMYKAAKDDSDNSQFGKNNPGKTNCYCNVSSKSSLSSAERIKDEYFSDGVAAYLLNNGDCNGVWRQGEAVDFDTLPVIRKPWEDAPCLLQKAETGEYLIYSKEDLAMFSIRINKLNDNKAKGLIMNDIDLTGTLEAKTVIGDASTNAFGGVLDGQYHTITLDYKDMGINNVALIGYATGGSTDAEAFIVRNLHLAGSIQMGDNNYGASLIGNKTGTGLIESVTSEVNINGTKNSLYNAGLISQNTGKLTMNYCGFFGKFTGACQSSAGLLYQGNNTTTINHSYVAANCETTTKTGMFWANNTNPSLNNCYYQAGSNFLTKQGTEKPASDFVDGTVGKLMNPEDNLDGPWYQCLGRDTVPLIIVECAVPVKPVIVSAEMNTTTKNITLSWNKVTKLTDGSTPLEGSISYKYDYATDKNFGNLIVNDANLTGDLNEGVYSTILADQAYPEGFIRIRAINPAGASANSDSVELYYVYQITFNYPSTSTVTDYRNNAKVKLSTHETEAVSSRKGWTITAGMVCLLNGDTLKASGILNEVTRDSIKVIGNATLQGYDPFDVTFDNNGITAATISPASKSVKFGEKYGDLATASCDGYIFNGWFTLQEDGEQVTADTYVTKTSAHNLYAHWTQGIVVTFKANGGTVDLESKIVYLGQPYGKLPMPTREKFNFQGWFTDSLSGNKVDSTTTVTLTTNHNLWAHWKEEKVGDGTGQTLAEATNAVNTALTEWKEACDAGDSINLTIIRKIYKDGYFNTLCLPFDLSNEKIIATFGEYEKFQKFESATVTGEEPNRQIEITLKDTDAIKAGDAYLISFADTKEVLDTLVFSGVKVTIIDPNSPAHGDNLDYQGVLKPVQLEYENKNLLFLGDKNKLYWPKKDDTFMKGFRAYFKVTTVESNPGSSSPYRHGMRAVFGEKTTPTSVHDAQCTMHEIQKLVEQGRVVIITNGKKYDLQGNLLD